MDTDALQPILAGIARHALTTAGGALVTGGYMQSSQMSAFVGGGMVVAGVAWSWWQKSGQAQTTALLKKLTASKTRAEAVEKAEVLPPADSAKITVAIAKAATGIATVLLVAFVLSFCVAAPAMAQKLTGNIVRDIQAAKGGGSSPLTGDPGYDLLKALDAKLLPDLEYALKLATASGSTVTAPCYQAWIDMINTQIKAVQDTSTTPPTDIPTPDPHVVTTFERLVELRNSLQPESQFMLKCSPVASMVKLDIAKFMGLVISGGAGIAALVPGL